MSSKHEHKDHRRKAQLALGVAVICALFLLETFVAHQKTPSAASGLVWTLLAGIAVAALALAGWYRHKACVSASRAAPE